MQTLSLVTVTLSLLITFLYSPTPTKATLIQDVCFQSVPVDYNSCTSLLESHPRASLASNLSELGVILVEMEFYSMKETKNIIANLQKNRGYPPRVHDGFATCYTGCVRIDGACELAGGSVKAGKFERVRNLFDLMGKIVKSCRSLMVGSRVEPLLQKLEESFVISHIGSVVMSMLLEKSSTPNAR